LNAQKFTQKILEIEPKVLYVAVVDSRAGTVVANEIRKGASLYTIIQWVQFHTLTLTRSLR
jgi:hypothetical protein